MKASEAKQLSKKNADQIAEKEAAEHQKRSEAAKQAAVTRHKKWKEEFERSIRSSIKTSIEYGGNSIERTLNSYSYIGGSIKTPLYGKQILEKSEYKVEMKAVLAKLKRDGYQVEITGTPVEHDESAAYMNSGGECGSETPYYTYDTILKVTW